MNFVFPFVLLFPEIILASKTTKFKSRHDLKALNADIDTLLVPVRWVPNSFLCTRRCDRLSNDVEFFMADFDKSSKKCRCVASASMRFSGEQLKRKDKVSSVTGGYSVIL